MKDPVFCGIEETPMSSSFVRLLHAKLLYSTIALAPLLFLLPAELQLESDSPNLTLNCILVCLFMNQKSSREVFIEYKSKIVRQKFEKVIDLS